MWYSPGDGVSVIDPRHLPFNKLPRPVHIEQITADRKTYETSSNLRLPPLVRDLEIDYTALSLVAPETVFFSAEILPLFRHPRVGEAPDEVAHPAAGVGGRPVGRPVAAPRGQAPSRGRGGGLTEGGGGRRGAGRTGEV